MKGRAKGPAISFSFHSSEWRIVMSEDGKKKQLWQSVLADKSFLKKEDSGSPSNIKSKIDKVYNELEIDRRYEQVREEEDGPDAANLGPRAS
jgi:hypothetical protein